MDFKMLKVNRESMCSAGIDNKTGYYYLNVPSGFANIPAYYPITAAEYIDFENMSYETLVYITNRYIQELSGNMYKLQWASAYNPLYAIAEKVKDDLWHYEIPGEQQSKLYKWDELIIAAYEDISAMQEAKLRKHNSDLK